MSTVAEQLRQGREAQRLTIEQMAELTKIRTDHLRALEEGDYNVFSAPVYIRGFVRTYSTLLKLEVAQVMGDLDAELGQTRKFAEPPSLSGPRQGLVDLLMLQLSKIDWQRGVIVLGVLAVVAGGALGYIAWHRSRTSDPTRTIPPAIYKPVSGNTGNLLPLPSGSAPKPELPQSPAQRPSRRN